MKTEELKQKCSEIADLIEQTNLSNVYDNIITFFQLTSSLHDSLDEIQASPIATKNPSWLQRIFKKKEAEEIDQLIRDQERQKRALIQTIKNCGRNMSGHNRTKKGEPITKENIFFGGIMDIGEFSVAKWEEFKTSEIIANQMLEFLQNKKNGFRQTNWL